MATMMSGRYKSDNLMKHWSKENPSGLCIHCGDESNLIGTLKHYLIECIFFQPTRENMFKLCEDKLSDNIHASLIFQKIVKNPEQNIFFSFLLDPSCNSDVIRGVQEKKFTLELIFSSCRTYCYAIHRHRMELLQS